MNDLGLDDEPKLSAGFSFLQYVNAVDHLWGDTRLNDMIFSNNKVFLHR